MQLINKIKKTLTAVSWLSCWAIFATLFYIIPDHFKSLLISTWPPINDLTFFKNYVLNPILVIASAIIFSPLSFFCFVAISVGPQFKASTNIYLIICGLITLPLISSDGTQQNSSEAKSTLIIFSLSYLFALHERLSRK